jgi:hypothetical protein
MLMLDIMVIAAIVVYMSMEEVRDPVQFLVEPSMEDVCVR